MLDPKLEDELMKEIYRTPGLGFLRSDSWTYDDVKAKVSLVMTRAYQEGQRDAFLAMGSYLKS